MKTKLVNVRLPEQLYSEGKEITETAGYANFQEFIKDSIRQQIRSIKKDTAMERLEKLYGSTRGKERKRLTNEEKDRFAEEFAKDLGRQKELRKRYGL